MSPYSVISISYMPPSIGFALSGGDVCYGITMNVTPQGAAPAARRSFSVRMPQDLYVQLERASESRGESMNKLVQQAVAELVGRADLAPLASGADVHPKIARDAVRQGPEAIGPLKGIAKWAQGRDQMALAAVCWAAAARLVTAQQGPEAGSQELSHSAAVFAQTNLRDLTIALYEEAVALDQNNLDAINRLGQLLHHAAQADGDNPEKYRQAAALLSRVTFVDDRARLFHGWSTFFVGRSDNDTNGVGQALGEIDEAMRRWAFAARDPRERLAWERQVNRLRDAGYPDRAAELTKFAEQHARWNAERPRP